MTSMRFNALFLRGLCCVLCLTVAAVAEDQPAEKKAEDLPYAEKVMEDFISATGGREAYEKLENRVAEGTISIPAMQIKGTFKIYEAAPNKLCAIQEIEGHGKQVQCTNGTDVWIDAPMSGGPRLLEGEQKEALLAGTTFNSELRWKVLHKSVEVVGTEEVDGKKAYKVKMVNQQDSEQFNYYDAESHLMVQSESSRETPMGNITIVTKVEDYREVGGVKVPFKMTQKTPVGEQIIAFDKVEHNVDLPADQFAVPEEAKAAAEKEKAEKEAAEAKDAEGEKAEDAKKPEEEKAEESK